MCVAVPCMWCPPASACSLSVRALMGSSSILASPKSLSLAVKRRGSVRLLFSRMLLCEGVSQGSGGVAWEDRGSGTPLQQRRGPQQVNGQSEGLR